ncbi:serine/threonine protein kinase [Myxosarcina sp. GI1(2024)]
MSNITNFPDLTTYGYCIEGELGHNREGGRITWKATKLADRRTVAIKQFCFATTDSSWSGYQAYEREIELLSKLQHPGIPEFIESLETERGFCLIQEYKDAPKLSDFRQLNLEEIEQVLLQVLDILIYLQEQTPPIFHRDLKPENILIGDRLQVYLVDFGFASLGSKEASVSSIFKGTPGFMPPEQIATPTTASDLYSLGVTAICLLTQKKSWQISELASEDNPYQLEFKSHLPPLSRQFVNWLEKMVRPQASKRFPNAAAAKAALEAIALEPVNNNLVKVNLERLLPVALKLGSIALLRPSKPILIGTIALAGLSTTAVVSVNYALARLDRTTVNLAIAIIAALVVAVTESAAVTIANTEEKGSKPAITIALVIPLVLVVIASAMLGRQAAIAIAAAITIAEIFNLSYCLLQRPLFKQNGTLGSIYLFGTILLGTSLGLKLIL